MPRYNATKLSDFEQMFSTQATFKRNSVHYDVLRLNQIEKRESLRRRKPRSTHFDAKVALDFSSSKLQLSTNLDSDIERCKLRLSFSEQTANQSAFAEVVSPQKIKGVSIDKSISRQHLDSLRKKCDDERQFTNFQMNQGNLSKTPSLQKYSVRKEGFTMKHINDLLYDCTKTYQKVYFDGTAEKCTFNLKVQNDEQGRYFFPKRRTENDSSTDLDPQKIAKSISMVSSFKPNRIAHFYRRSDRNSPCQLDQRHLSPNCNFYKDMEGKLIKPRVDYTAKFNKEKLLERDRKEFESEKQHRFSRDQICDQRYFLQEQRVRS